MNKVLIVGIIVGVIAIGGIGAYALFSGGGTSDTSNNVAGNSETVGSFTEQASIEELLTRNASLKCTYSMSEAGTESTGVAYFAGGKNMYGEFTYTSNGESTQVYSVRNGDTQYVWTKDATIGFKTDVSTSDKASQQQQSQQFDPEEKYAFACVNWNKDDSLFTPPASVSFTDVSAQSRQLEEAMDAADQNSAY